MRLTRFEARLEGVIEGLFGKKISAESVMRSVARAFEDAIAAQPESPTAAALVYLTIQLHPADHTVLLNHYPYIDRQIVAYVTDVARVAGITLGSEPVVTMYPNKEQERGNLSVFVSLPDGDTPLVQTSTQQMESSPAVQLEPPRDAQLVRDGRTVLRLNRYIINIGRRAENHLVLEDHRISRQHCQIRLRDGRYVVYDLNSRHGVFVNNQRVSEYVLQNGDVISLGGVQLLYLQEEATDDLSSLDDDTSMRPPEEWS